MKRVAIGVTGGIENSFKDGKMSKWLTVYNTTPDEVFAFIEEAMEKKAEK